jgi:hypothetical protein
VVGVVVFGGGVAVGGIVDSRVLLFVVVCLWIFCSFFLPSSFFLLPSSFSLLPSSFFLLLLPASSLTAWGLVACWRGVERKLEV